MNYFDLHCDTISKMFKDNKDFDDKGLDVNSCYGEKFNKWYQCFAVFVNEKQAEPFTFYKEAVKCYKAKILNKKPKNLTPVLTLENAQILEGKIDRVYKLKEDNVKIVTLTWNNENCLGGGAYSDVPLKKFGIEVIKKLNELEILTDLSHLNKKSFLKAVELSDYPICTHSSLNEVYNHKRNIDISMAKLIAQKGGIIGLCPYREFLGDNDIFQKFYENVYLCLENGLEKNIAVGSDFDGCDNDFTLKEIPRLYGFLSDKKIDKKTLDIIFFNNAKSRLKKL